MAGPVGVMGFFAIQVAQFVVCGPLVSGDRSAQVQRESTDDRKLREQGYIRINRFCDAMDRWAHVCQKELPPITNIIVAGAKSSVNIGSSYAWRSERAVYWIV